MNRTAIITVKQEDISPVIKEEPISEDEFDYEDGYEMEMTEIETDKKFKHLDELHDALYEGESDSEWEDADQWEDTDDEDDELVLDKNAIEFLARINDLDKKLTDLSTTIDQTGVTVNNLTDNIDCLKSEVDALKNNKHCKQELKEKKKQLAMDKKALKTVIEEKKEANAEYKRIHVENTKIKEALKKYVALANYFKNDHDALIQYVSNEEEFRNLFRPLKCKDELDRSLFFNDTYDVNYNAEASDYNFKKHRVAKYGSEPITSVAQLEWDENYESLYGLNDYDLEKLNMKQLKFLCVEFNVPRDGKKIDIVERLKSPYELYVPKKKRTRPLDTFKTADPNQDQYDKLMKEKKSFYKDAATMKILRQRKIMGCQLMRESKERIKYMFIELGLDFPKGKHEDLVKTLIDYYYEIY